MSYTLTKPPKGSNVSGEELLQPLVQTKDSLALQLIHQTEWLATISAFVDGDLCDDDDGSFQQSKQQLDHSYDIKYTDDRVVSHVAGFVVKKVIGPRTRNPCLDCVASFEDRQIIGTAEEKESRHAFTALRCKGGLVRSSNTVFNLIKDLEDIVLETISSRQMNRRIMFQIVNNLSRIKNLSFVGCEVHKKDMTKKFIGSFLRRRANMLCNKHNDVNNAQRKKTIFSRKMAKLARANQLEQQKSM